MQCTSKIKKIQVFFYLGQGLLWFVFVKYN